MGTRSRGVDTHVREIEEKVISIVREIEMKQPEKEYTAEDIARIFLQSGVTVQQEYQTEKVLETTSLGTENMIDRYAMEYSRKNINNSWQVQYYRNIYSCRPIIGKMIVFCKRIVRKLLKFLIEPIVEEQTRFNAEVVQAINSLCNNDVVFEAHIMSLSNSVTEIKEQLSGIQNKLSANIVEIESKQDLEAEYSEERDQVFRELQKINEKVDNILNKMPDIKTGKKMRM